MNKRSQQEDRLLADAFHDEWANGRAGGFARAAAAHVRRRRRAKRTLGGLALSAAGACALVLAMRQPPPPARIAENSPARPAYEIISDEELLAQLRDRPLVVVQKANGGREFMLPENVLENE